MRRGEKDVNECESGPLLLGCRDIVSSEVIPAAQNEPLVGMDDAILHAVTAGVHLHQHGLADLARSVRHRTVQGEVVEA